MILPETQQAIIYHPFENERFLKMVETKSSLYVYLGVHYDDTMYKDFDEDYYEQDNCTLFY